MAASPSRVLDPPHPADLAAVLPDRPDRVLRAAGARTGSSGRPAICAMLQDHLLPFLGFLGNWSMALIRPIPSDWLSVLWSVCVEEQFYLIVPLLIALVAPAVPAPAGRASDRRLDRRALGGALIIPDRSS